MKGGTRPLGYTIIEVMIVLAVSGVMFVLASAIISGKQEKTSFTAGVNEMASRLQTVIGQVTDGHYSDVPFSCSYSSSRRSLALTGNPSSGNPDCTFLGKIMQFGESPGGVAPADPTKYEIFSIAGSRLDYTTGQPASSLSGAIPTAIAFPSASPPIDLTEQNTIAQALNVVSVTIIPTATPSPITDVYAFGFLQGLATTDPVTGAIISGANPVSMYYVSGLSSGQNESAAASMINASSLKQATSATICLSDGTQYADLTLGTNNNQLSVNVQFRERAVC